MDLDNFVKFKRVLETCENHVVQRACLLTMRQYANDRLMHLGNMPNRYVYLLNEIENDTEIVRRTRRDGTLNEENVDNVIDHLRNGKIAKEFGLAIYYWFHAFVKNDLTYAKMIDAEIIAKYPHLSEELESFFLASQINDDALLSAEPLDETNLQLCEYQMNQNFDDDSWLNPENQSAIPFIGRKEELGRLEKFASDPRLFLVWAISGPSGAGKTRLMLEWMYSRSQQLNGWKKYILKPKDRDPEIWKGWEPTGPSIIVIDYVQLFTKTIRTIIDRGRQLNRETGNYCVRLLVIDHVFPKDLRNIVLEPRWGLSDLSGRELDPIKALFFDKQPISLLETSDQETILEGIIAELVGKDPQSSIVKSAISHLRSMAGAWHPLFAALVGEAIKFNRDYSNWNRRDLIYYYLTGKNRLPWKYESIAGQWAACLIAVATARNGVLIEPLIACVPVKHLSTNQKREIVEICKTRLSVTNNGELKPFEPHILGESFFLLFLEEIFTMPQTFHVPFFNMLIAGEETVQIDDAYELLEFISRMTRNLTNDDQESQNTINHWMSLYSFLKSDSFPNNVYLKWAVAAASVEFAVTAEDNHNSEEYKIFLRQINDAALFDIRAQCYGFLSLMHPIRYAELVSKEDLFERKILDRLHILFENYSKSEHTTPLITSIQCGLTNLATFMIDVNVNIDERPESVGITPLVAAIIEENEDLIRVLIDRGADLNKVTAKFNLTPLMVAVLRGKERTAKMLIEAGADPHLFGMNSGYTALMMACEEGNTEICQLLLDAKVDLQQHRKMDQYTALMIAASKGHTTIFDMLIKAGASTDQPLDEYGIPQFVKLCLNNEVMAVACFIDVGTNIDITTRDESLTAMMVAISSGHVEVVSLLAKAQQDLDKEFYEGGPTALMLALTAKNEAIVRVLLDEGADVNNVDSGGLTPIMSAVSERKLDILKILIGANADVEARDKVAGITALMIASRAGYEEIIQELLLANANVNAIATTDGSTALMQASEAGHVNVVKALLDAGSDIEIERKDSVTALMLSISFKNDEVRDILFEAGVSFNFGKFFWNRAKHAMLKIVGAVFGPFRS